MCLRRVSRGCRFDQKPAQADDPRRGRALIDHALDLGALSRPERIVREPATYKPTRSTAPAGRDVPDDRGTAYILLKPRRAAQWRCRLWATAPFYMKHRCDLGGPNPLSLLADAWALPRWNATCYGRARGASCGHAGDGDFTDGCRRSAETRAGGSSMAGSRSSKPSLFRDAFQSVPSRLNFCWDVMLDRGRMYGLAYPGRWCDCGPPRWITLAEDMLDAGRCLNRKTTRAFRWPPVFDFPKKLVRGLLSRLLGQPAHAIGALLV